MFYSWKQTEVRPDFNNSTCKLTIKYSIVEYVDVPDVIVFKIPDEACQ